MADKMVFKTRKPKRQGESPIIRLTTDVSRRLYEIEEHEYKVYCERAISWNLSEYKTQKIVDKIYDFFSKSLSLDASHVSVAVAGASNYNAKKLDKSDKILENSAQFVDWFTELEKQATRKKHSRTVLLMKEIIWGVSEGYNVNDKWRELAGRNIYDFKTVYEELNQKIPFKKNSVAYKIYHGLIKIEEIIQSPIYSDADFCAYQESEKIVVEFRLKPQRQLIVALKSRKFYWDSSNEVWKAQFTEELKNWVKAIREKYNDYI